MAILDKLSGKTAKPPQQDEPISISSLLEQQLQKLATLTSDSLAKEVRTCLSSCPIGPIVRAKGDKAFADMRPHSDYCSPPITDFAVAVLVVPCTLSQARDHFLKLYPTLGVVGEMMRMLENPLGQYERQTRGKKGVVFAIVCLSPDKRRPSLNLALWPSSKEFGEVVPCIAPMELIPDIGLGEGTHAIS
jgi:hypothetical protein